MSRFLLLTPLIPSMFGMNTYNELIESLNEFGCGYLQSMDPLGNVVYFATASNKDIMTNMTETVEMPGIVIEYTAVYDQAVVI
jgi:hypothetical protein